MTYLYIFQILLTGTARLALKAALALIIFLIVPVPTLASVSDWQQGASILPTSQPAFSSGDFQESLRDLKDTGANYVTFIIQQYQTTMESNDIRSGWNTPPDEDLAAAIDYAHSLGLNVMLKPHIDVTDPDFFRWRAHINPDNRDEWYRNYENMLLHYARLGEEHGVEMMSIGAELIDVATETSNPDNTRRWEGMIQSVRSVFSGDLTYSANWGADFYSSEKDHIEFWDDLDYIGISAYFELREGSSVEDMRRAWDEWRRTDIEPLQEEWGKPILFTEIGYRSVEGAHEQPWSHEKTGAYDPGIQERAYEALFSYWDDYSYMQGVHLWRWDENPNAGGQGNTDYTPQNKPALETITAWFTEGGTDGGDDSGGGASAGEFSAQASIDGGAVEDNPVELDVGVLSSAAVSNTVVDVEIYNNSGSQVFQTFFEDQSFASGEEKSYSATWSPADAGTYTVMVGVFESGWSSVLSWEGNALTFAVEDEPGSGEPNGPEDPNQVSGGIDIWWPGDGVAVSGVQPFKAMVPGRDVSTYEMYWRVDGDRLNGMYSSDVDYPHKEAIVNLSSWNWKDNDTYTIAFVAQEGGATFAEEEIDIVVR